MVFIRKLFPVLEKIEKKYGIGKAVVVADAAMLWHNNIAELTNQKKVLSKSKCPLKGIGILTENVP
jgi:hypothetical protein